MYLTLFLLLLSQPYSVIVPRSWIPFRRLNRVLDRLHQSRLLVQLLLELFLAWVLGFSWYEGQLLKFL